MRLLIALSLGLAAGIFGFAACMGLAGSRLIAALAAALLAGLLALWVFKRPVLLLAEQASPRWLKIVSALATGAALVQLARLTVFMVDPAQVGYSSFPSSQWEIHHSCVSAYFVAAEAASTHPNVYDDALYSLPDDNPQGLRKARMIGPFNIDVFEYPPPFLLLPRALRLPTPDFLRFRLLWFGLNGGFVLLALLVSARLLGPTAGTRALLLSPLVWCALPTLSTLQKGNVQAAVIAAAMLAMVLFQQKRDAAGGILLAFATVSKLYPGMLVVYLLARRQWRALAWTAAFALLLSSLTFLDLGPATYTAFLDHLPGLLGGEAFPAFRNPAAMAVNFSIPGLIFKLKLFGVPGMSFGAAKIVGWIYTLVAVAVTVLAGRRAGSDEAKPLAWLAILILATLRSPFLPQGYAAFPSLWLLTLIAANAAPTIRTLSLVVLAWIALNVYLPHDWPIDPRLLAIANVVPQTLTVLLAGFVLGRTPRRATAGS